MTTRLTSLLTARGSHAAKSAAAAPRVWLAPNRRGDGPAELEVLLADISGRVIGEMQADVKGVAWKLNNYGQARMLASRAEYAQREHMVQFGNRLMIRFNNGLPDWGGVIDTPRKWGDDMLEVVAYSGEYLLGWRITDRGRYFTSATVGDIYRAVIREAEPFGVEIGYLWPGGNSHSTEYQFESLLDIAESSLGRRLETIDWDVRPSLVNGRIRFSANLYQRRGLDYTSPARSRAFVEGVNVSGSMSEQGPIANDIYLAGAGTGWGEDTRIYAQARDDNSERKFGLRQLGETLVDITPQETLDNAAANRLERYGTPRQVFSLTAWDHAPARFGDYDVGDTIWAEMFSVGFGGGVGQSVRVMAREFQPGDNTMQLVVQ